MRAVTYSTLGEARDVLTLTEMPTPTPAAGEVLVRIVATGLCHTDITMRSFLPAEMFPNVFGHEGTGVVEQVGPGVENVAVGDHVVLSFNSCQACSPCQEGIPAYCEQTLLLNYFGMRLDGSTTMSRDGSPVFGSFFGQSSFSQHALVAAECCVVVDPALDLTTLAPFGCGYQTGVGTGLNVLQPARVREDGRTGLAVSDFFDFSVYVDAGTSHIRQWYVERFMRLRETAFRDPGSYFGKYVDLDHEAALAEAARIWDTINGPNLTDNVLPTRSRATLVLRKDRDHSVRYVRLRKL